MAKPFDQDSLVTWGVVGYGIGWLMGFGTALVLWKGL